MRYFQLSTLAATAISFSSVTALGINCRGSSMCGYSGWNADITGVRGALAQLIVDGHGQQHYDQGQQLGCSNNLCAYYQNLPGGESAQTAYSKVTDLVNHGCTQCGSCPTQDGNDVSTGEITLNYVTSACCTGPSCYCL